MSASSLSASSLSASQKGPPVQFTSTLKPYPVLKLCLALVGLGTLGTAACSAQAQTETFTFNQQTLSGNLIAGTATCGTYSLPGFSQSVSLTSGVARTVVASGLLTYNITSQPAPNSLGVVFNTTAFQLTSGLVTASADFASSPNYDLNEGGVNYFEVYLSNSTQTYNLGPFGQVDVTLLSQNPMFPNNGLLASNIGTGVPTNAYGDDYYGPLTYSLLLHDVPAAVPEASTTVSSGLLLALGMGGVVIAARKKKAAASA